ncbi:Putative oxidoreductase [hydrothermal vent metagenome]|uniref:Oxidoreductase n=1 Tax=hydrothermal vent metagenome TaxID=652676 RepID=A0A3B0TY91_9ZZZZ
MSKTYGVGILGCGVISNTYLKLAPLFKGLEVRAVADIMPEAAQKKADEFALKAQTPDQLLANPDLDIIVNLTIPEVHYQTTKEIVLAGKHAYSEKPLVLSLKDGLDLKDLAKEHGVQIGCAPDTFLGGAHQQARFIIDNGEVGEITSGTCHVLSAGMESWHPNPDFFFRPGGGPILDLGPYYIANLINLVGPVRRVSAFASTPKKFRTIGSGPRKGEKVPVSTPTSVHGVLEFANGALITLGASWDVIAHNHPNMELYGSEGSIFVPDPNFFGGQIGLADAKGERSIVEPWDHPFGVANEERKNGKPMVANYRTAGFADMVQAIKAGRKPRCSLETTLHGVDVMVSILKAAESGTIVSLQTSCERPLPLGPDQARELLR